MSTDSSRSKVIIIGTAHLEPAEYPEFADSLQRLIEDVHPDVICSELSPEQLDGSQTCNSKPEQRDIVMPTAKRLNIPIIPIQMPTDVAIEWEKGKNKALDDIKNQEANRYYLELLERLAIEEYKLWMQFYRQPGCFENLQMTEHHLLFEARDAVMKEVIPEYWTLHEGWNESFLTVINDTIAKNQGRTIMVIAGGGHKFWLWNKLKVRDDIELYNVQSYKELMSKG